MQKIYVPVEACFDTQGRILPRALTWEDDWRFVIERVLDIRRASSHKVDGVGLRYTVRIAGVQRYLWLEDGNR